MLALFPLLTGCQIGYLVKSAYGQADLLRQRVSIDKALQSDKLTEDQKNKLRLAQEARTFAETDLGLKHTSNYTTFVQLDRPYVTYVVSAAEKNELKSHLFYYPIVGSLPYKGFFNPEGAKKEAEELRKEGYDVYVRGVTAFSTLGWFSDPIVSSMLGYKDFDLVDTIIHETTHATVYIRSEADFNERMAVFFGNKGAIEFYKKKEGPESKTIKAMADDLHDEKVFSEFIFKEIESLTKWYEERKLANGVNFGGPGAATLATVDPAVQAATFERDRLARIKEIQERFRAEARPLMRSADSYKGFETSELNNARLLTYKLYFENLDDFEAVFHKLGDDFHKMLEFCKSLEKSKDPKADLAKAAHDS